MVVALVPSREPSSVVTAVVADGVVEVEVWPADHRTVVACRALGVTITLSAPQAREIGACLHRAAAVLEQQREPRRHLRHLGSWQLPVSEAGVFRVELDAVRDDSEDVRGALMSIDDLGLEGYLPAEEARRFGDALLMLDPVDLPATLRGASSG